MKTKFTLVSAVVVSMALGTAHAGPNCCPLTKVKPATDAESAPSAKAPVLAACADMQAACPIKAKVAACAKAGAACPIKAKVAACAKAGAACPIKAKAAACAKAGAACPIKAACADMQAACPIKAKAAAEKPEQE